MVYEPDGVLRGQLPVPMSWSAAFPFDDLSSMTLEYINSAPGAEMLTAPCEVALELAGPNGVFSEPPDCRFINIRQTQDLTSPETTTKLTMPSYGWLLNKALNILFADFNDNGNRPFNTYPAAIVKTFIDDAHDRGNIPFLTYNFTASEDSDGQAWTDTLNVSITAGQSAYTTITTFVGQGLFDWRMNKRELELYKTDTFLNRDLTTNPTAVKLQPARDISGAPDDMSWEDITKKALIQGDNSTFIVAEGSTNPTPWGDWEGFMTQSGVTDKTVMEQLGQRFLETGSGRRAQITREIVFSYNSPLPLINYRPGDHILARDETGTFDDLRVRQITLTNSDGAIKGNVVLGDKFTERDLRFQKRLAALSGGSNTIGGSGTTPVTPSPSVPDTRVPKQVTGVGTAYTTTIDSNGLPMGTIDVSWSAVTEATDNSAMDINGYRIQWQLAPNGNYQQRTVDATALGTSIGESIQVLQTYNVQVAAIGVNGVQGAWSEVSSIFVGPDETAPPVPSTPTITGRLGTLRVHWDGRDEDGLNMPADLAIIEVEIGSAESGPFSLIGTMVSSATDLIVAEQPYGEERFFRLRAKDTSGNYSDYSAVASGTPTQTSTVDIEAGSITSDLIEAGAVTAEKIAAYSIDATRLTVGSARNLIADPNFVDPILSQIRVDQAQGLPNSGTSILWSWESNAFIRAKLTETVATNTGRFGLHASATLNPNLTAGSNTPPNLAYPVDQTMGSIIFRIGLNISLASGTWPDGASVNPTVNYRWIHKDGSVSLGFSAAGNVFTAVTGEFVNYTSEQIAVPSDAVAIQPYGRVTFTNCTPEVLVDFAVPFLAQASGEVLIEDGAITADKIVANAITAVQLDADAITAKHTITGALFQTDTSGNRVVISPDANFLGQPGIRIYSGLSGARDSSMFLASNTTGGWVQGQFVLTGPEVTRNSSGRTDLQLLVGGAGFGLAGQYVSDSLNAGILSPDSSNEVLLMGSLPRGTALGDALGAIRAFTSTFQNGSITWGYNNGWAYRGAVCPNISGSTPRYGSISTSSATSLTWVSSGSVQQVDLFLYRGGFIGD
jgi:hypothetical protein